MWKYWLLVVLVIQVAVNTVSGKVLEPPNKDAPEPKLYFGFPVQQYAKIAREIVHQSSSFLIQIFIFLQKFIFSFDDLQTKPI